jgi:hypothetical protein
MKFTIAPCRIYHIPETRKMVVEAVLKLPDDTVMIAVRLEGEITPLMASPRILLFVIPFGIVTRGKKPISP